MSQDIIKPGSTIGILGGGQLGKMSAAAAHALGYKTVVWGQSEDEPALQACTYRIVAPFTDASALAEFCNKAQVATTEWENIPVPLLQEMEGRGLLVRPSSKVLAIAQSRRAEKGFARSIGAEPVPHLYIPGPEALQDAEDYSDLFPGILKTDRLGYDGRGQMAISDQSSLIEAVERFAVPCVLEKRMLLDSEYSALVARSACGEMSVSDCVRNVHKDGILSQTSWCQGMLPEVARRDVAGFLHQAAESVALEGILVIEFFVSEGRLYFNELAPRPHNSFHGSIEAARTSQFEQHVRAICNLPLGSVTFRDPFVMRNLIGNTGDLQAHLAQAHVSVHLYGKGESRPGRKMGHVTTIVPCD